MQSITRILIGVATIVKNTHRHPANRALHGVGLVFYVLGASIVLGQLTGSRSALVTGVLLWASAIGIMATGHAIEGNVKSMTPVLVGRLLLRAASSRRYSEAKRVELG